MIAFIQFYPPSSKMGREVANLTEIKNLQTSHGGWGVSSIACHASAAGVNPACSNGNFWFIKKLIWTPPSDKWGGYINHDSVYADKEFVCLSVCDELFEPMSSQKTKSHIIKGSQE